MGIKKYVVGAIIGGLVGLWSGVNIGKNQPIWGNPFAEQERGMADKAKTKAQELVKDAKKALREKLDE